MNSEQVTNSLFLSFIFRASSKERSKPNTDLKRSKEPSFVKSTGLGGSFSEQSFELHHQTGKYPRNRHSSNLTTTLQCNITNATNEAYKEGDEVLVYREKEKMESSLYRYKR